MKIVIPHSFKKDFEKDFSRYQISIQDLIELLQKTTLISLQFPYFKIKGFIKGISIRGIIKQREDGLIVPLLFFLKTHRLGENLILNKEIQKIIDINFDKFGYDLVNGFFDLYE